MDRSSPRAAAGLVGRDRERDVLLAAIGEVRPYGPGVVLRGAPGIGKSALLAMVRDEAERSGATVLSTVGVPAEALLPFAGLHRLVRPVAGLAKVLPEPQRAALSSAFGEADDALAGVLTADPDRSAWHRAAAADAPRPSPHSWRRP
jgi:predicted ATPase